MQRFLVLVAMFSILLSIQSADAAVRTLKIGTSPYSIQIPNDYIIGEMTDEEKEDGMIGYYYSENELMDFDIYQFSKEGEPSKLIKYAEKEAAEYGSTIESGKINGIKVAYYLASEEHGKKMYPTITYIFDTKKDYLEIVFWLDGDKATEQAMQIINSLKRN